MFCNLESVADVDDEGGIVGANAHPLAVPENLQATNVILVQNGQHLGVGVPRNAQHALRIFTHRVVVHPPRAIGIRRLQSSVRVTLQPQRFRQLLHDEPRQLVHGPEERLQILSASADIDRSSVAIISKA